MGRIFQERLAGLKKEGKYKNLVVSSVQLDKPLSEDIAKKVVASPEFQHKLAHGLLQFSRTNGQPFEPNYLLSQGDEYLAQQPVLEANDPGTFENVDVSLEGNRKYCKNKLTQPSQNTAFYRMKIIFEYDKESQTYSIGMVHDPANPLTDAFAKIVFDLICKRVQSLAKNPEATLKELEELDTILQNITLSRNTSPNPSTPFTMEVSYKLCKSFSMEDLCQKDLIKFTKELFHLAEGFNQQEGHITFTDKVSVVSRLTPSKETVPFGAKLQGANRYQVSSTKPITNFNALQYQMTTETNNGNTKVTITIHYGEQGLVSIISGAVRGMKAIGNFFSNMSNWLLPSKQEPSATDKGSLAQDTTVLQLMAVRIQCALVTLTRHSLTAIREKYPNATLIAQPAPVGGMFKPTSADSADSDDEKVSELQLT